ncbi:tyrosine-type recombinase/integrase [Psychrobacter sp. JCM 18902]|uniref:tyrosine-type recombinase/integrase n=1 Tax=Psychrobacter sp. JCM 18902 TaxID=1298607 RepID=UPI0019198E36|nr:site-specific integrase [Psychrobacter sp. JCM 18902]
MSNNKSGAEIRKENRDQREEKRFLLARKLIDKYIDFIKILESEDHQKSFNLMWAKFDKNLSTNKHFQDVRKYSTAYSHAVKYCQDRMEDKNITIGFPKLIIQSSRPASFRTQEWFSDGKDVLDFYLDWSKRLEAQTNIDLTLNDVFLSLIFHSAVLKVSVLQAILKQLSDDCLMIEQVYGLPIIAVIVDDSSYHTNTYVGTEAVHQTQVFISPLSAHILQSYIKEKAVPVADKLKNINIYNLYQSMRQTLESSVNFGLRRFLIAAVYILENHLLLNLPEYMWYIVTGKEDTFSLPTCNWQSLIYEIRHDTTNQEQLSNQVPSTSNNISTVTNSQLAVEIAKIFKSDSNNKISKKLFVKKLKKLDSELKNSYAPLNERAIVGWLLSMTTSHMVSSIQTYSNRITNRWLALTENSSLKDYQEDDFVALYTEMIELSKTPKAANAAAELIDKIHQYMVAHHNIESIPPFATSDRSHHRVGYISESMFQAILNKIDSLTMTVDEKQAISLTLILGQRCGLRIGEIVKIRIRDIAETQNYLEVRNNKFGNNKSLSALRRISLSQLLLESDMQLIRRVYIKRSRYKNQTLIANQAGMPYNSNAISKIISSLIKEVTGLKYLTTHHLRHSCLTNFQLMSFLYDKDYKFNNHSSAKFLKSLLPYEDKQAVNIINHFETSLAYKKVYALAGVAGHASPSTTFASYVHLTDIQIGLLLYHVDFKLSVKHAPLLKTPRRRKHEIENVPLKINEYLIYKMKLPELPQPKSSKSVSENLTKQTDKTKRYAFDEVNQILEAYTEKGDYEYLMHIYDVSQETFETWHHNAKRLREASEFQTTKGNPRLFDPNNKHSLLPVKDRYGDDRKNMIRMTDKFRDIYKGSNDKGAINKFVFHTLINAQPSKNFIIFKHPADIYNYLEIVCQLVYKKDISLKVYNYEQASEADQTSWNLALKTIPRSQMEFNELDYAKVKSYQKKIRAELSLTSQTQPIRIENRLDSNIPISQWSVRTLQIFCHYVYIMIGEKLN